MEYIDYRDYIYDHVTNYNLSDSDIELMKLSTLYY